MASVTSLDQDMKKLRLGRYTPQAANETRSWIESTLGEKLSAGDLLDALKDGTALCKLANLAVPSPGIKFKKSLMPFMQMENISQFLRVCELPPLNLHAHDRFLTVDLYESKDPAQVLQCIGAFSRVANSINPRGFPDAIGPKKSGPTQISDYSSSNGGFDRSRNGAVSSMSQSTNKGPITFNPISQRALSPHYSGKSSSSNTTEGGPKSPQGGVSSWSKRSDQGTTNPAWNIAQYGYMGGASQGNQGISFGARRQITTPGPKVPSLAEKERLRKEQEALAGEAENRRRKEIEEEEERERLEEERRWEEETRERKEEEKRQVEEQKREWEEQERRWNASEEERLREEQSQKQVETEPQRKRGISDARLQGQFLSQYQAEQAAKPRSRRNSNEDPERAAEQARVRELERQLEEAKERERQYMLEREERDERRAQRHVRRRSRSRSRSKPAPKQREVPPRESDVSWIGDEREYLRKQWTDHQEPTSTRPLPEPTRPSTPPSLPGRPLPDPTASYVSPPPSGRPLPEPTPAVASPPSPTRPLPNPSEYKAPPAYNRSPFAANRTSRFLASNPAPVKPSATTYTSPDNALSSAAESAMESQRRMQVQQKTKAGGWAAKSIVEREMEAERERQREWEEGQKEQKTLARDDKEGSAPGQTWDVNMYGFTGGDSQNRVGTGIGLGGRRQIIGPRPKPGQG